MSHTRISRSRSLLLLSLFLVGSCYANKNLRGKEPAFNVEETNGETIASSSPRGPRQRRKLQRLFTAVLNSLISIATPNISEKLLYVVNKYYRTYDIQWLNGDEFLGEEAYLKQGTAVRKIMLPSICNASLGEVDSYVKYDYSLMLTSLDGVGEMNIDTIALVTGSQHIDLFFQSFRYGADWDGQWLIENTFPNLTAS